MQENKFKLLLVGYVSLTNVQNVVEILFSENLDGKLNQNFTNINSATEHLAFLFSFQFLVI